MPLANEVTSLDRARSSEGSSEATAFLRIIVWNEPMISHASVSGGMACSIAAMVMLSDLVSVSRPVVINRAMVRADGTRCSEAGATPLPDRSEKRVVADRRHQPVGKARAGTPSQRKTGMENEKIEPGRASRPGGDGPVIEALGENPAFATWGAAPEPPRGYDQPDRSPSQWHISRPTRIPAVHRRCASSTVRAVTGSALCSNHNFRHCVAGNEPFERETLRDERGGADWLGHDADPPREVSLM